MNTRTFLKKICTKSSTTRLLLSPLRSGSLRAVSATIPGLLLSSFRSGNIAMFHNGRSGSTVMGNLLRQHPNIFWDGELYTPPRLKMYSTQILPYKLARDPIKILNLRKVVAGKKFYGFETQLTQLNNINIQLPHYIQLLHDSSFSHFITLERRNYLRRIVSILIGRITSRWHQGVHEKTTLTRIELAVDHLWIRGPDFKPLLVHLQDQRKEFLELKEVLNSRRVLQLTYEEDIAANPFVGYQRICEFLDVANHEVSIRNSKTNPFKLRDIIINFDEVERTLHDTLFEWMLYD